ncbi:acylneuraminate cytidylyltransferase [Marisediminicola senii]|uniref:acylneuraminate cytidylyltransferase n=1 Tax=Marisediminicola senii TaxID=2711233 RepID=UPI001912E1B5|nr:acylneuraminate cytidylyltransferase [Marisediminicola senii]
MSDIGVPANPGGDDASDGATSRVTNGATIGSSGTARGRVVVVVPARGGSKGIPGKNLTRVGGVPLVVRAVTAAVASTLVDLVVVSTDDDRIAQAAEAAGAVVVARPAELSGDEAGSEAAVLHALDALRGGRATEDPEVVVMVQATSPFIDASDMDAAIRRVLDDETDSVFAAIETHDFVWTLVDGAVSAVGHDAAHRPRRQDRAPHYRETGAFYVMRTEGFRTGGHRFFGRLGIAVVDPMRAIEIDTPDDLEAARALAPLLDRIDGAGAARGAVPPGGTGFACIDALVTDFDGVHTDDLVAVSTDGQESVTVSRADGLGVEQLRTAGLPMLILSRERNAVVTARGRKLGVEVVQGIDDKAPELRDWAAGRGIDLDRVAYLGNDVNDLGCLAIVGWPMAVRDAHPAVIHAARVVLDARGGHGAVREFAERRLAAGPVAAAHPVATAPAVAAAHPVATTPTQPSADAPPPPANEKE